MRLHPLSRSLLATMLMLAASAIPQVQSPAFAQTLVLRGARVIDGTGASPLDNATIVIRDGRIAAIGPPARPRCLLGPRWSTIPARPSFLA